MDWYRARLTRSDLVAAIVGDHNAYMDHRREIMGAITQLTTTERAQLLLYLLEADYQALEIIDGRKWRYYEHLDRTPKERQERLAQATDSPGHGVLGGEDLGS